MLKKYVCILMPFIIGVLTVIFLNDFLDNSIDKMLEQKNLYSINTEYGSIYKDRGKKFNEYVTEKEGVVLQASSELAAPVSQIPTYFFPVDGIDYFVTNGRAYSQNLNQISTIASQKNSEKKRKVALIVSLQWFMNEGGIDNGSFQANFGPVQFYSFLENEKISDEHKNQYAKRIATLLGGSGQFAPERLYAEAYNNKTIKGVTINTLFKPYFIARKYIVTLKDKGTLYKKLKSLPDRGEDTSEKVQVDWEAQKVKAEDEAKAQTTNNDIYVFDNYYENNLKNNLESQKDVYKDVKLMKSKEFEDYELYLDTCVDLGIEPYIILMPTNGRWYDYTGMTKESRDEFFDAAQKLAEERGIEVLNLKDDEYTPYFMADVMHLGTKGWLKVDEAIYEHFKTR